MVKQKRWIRALLVLLITAGMLAAGCSSSKGKDAGSSAKSESPKPQKLVIALGHGMEYIGVDPFGPGRENTVLETAIYEPLALETEDGKFEPALAESWENTPDGLRWTFKLRRGVKFHDGSDFDARAVESAFARYQKDPDTNRRLGIKGIEVADPHTVTFVLKGPSATFLSVVGSFSAVIPSPAGFDESGKLVKPIGTGPFIVKSFNKQQVELEAHSGHWRGKPRLDSVTVRYLPDPSTMILALESGEVDLIGADGYGVPRNEIKRLQGNSALKTMIHTDTTSLEWVGFNLQREPLTDIRIRQAISYAIDRDSLVKHLMEGFGRTAVGPLGYDASIPWTNTAIKGYSYDPGKAKTLLTEAGWADSNGDGVLDKNGKALQLTMLFEGSRDWKLYAEAIQQDLAKVGIKVALEPRDSDLIRDMQKQGNFDLVALASIGKSKAEPHFYFYYYYTSRGPATVFRDNKKLDGIINRIATTVDRGEREKLYHEAQAEIWAQVPGAYLIHPARVTVTRADVEGWHFAGTMDPLRWLWQVYRK